MRSFSFAPPDALALLGLLIETAATSTKQAGQTRADQPRPLAPRRPQRVLRLP